MDKFSDLILNSLLKERKPPKWLFIYCKDCIIISLKENAKISDSLCEIEDSYFETGGLNAILHIEIKCSECGKKFINKLVFGAEKDDTEDEY